VTKITMYFEEKCSKLSVLSVTETFSHPTHARLLACKGTYVSISNSCQFGALRIQTQINKTDVD
jgi:hypothetical protein